MCHQKKTKNNNPLPPPHTQIIIKKYSTLTQRLRLYLRQVIGSTCKYHMQRNNSVPQTRFEPRNLINSLVEHLAAVSLDRVHQG